MGKQGKNQYGFEDCSPCFPCEVCVVFNNIMSYRKKYPKGMDPNLRPYKRTFKSADELLEYLKNDNK